MLCWLDVGKCNVRNVQTIFSILLNACFLSTILQPGSLFLFGLLNPNEGIFTYNELFNWVFMLGMDAGESNSHNSIKAFGWLWMWAHKSLKLFSKFTHFKMLQLECKYIRRNSFSVEKSQLQSSSKPSQTTISWLGINRRPTKYDLFLHENQSSTKTMILWLSCLLRTVPSPQVQWLNQWRKMCK